MKTQRLNLNELEKQWRSLETLLKSRKKIDDKERQTLTELKDFLFNLWQDLKQVNIELIATWPKRRKE